MKSVMIAVLAVGFATAANASVNLVTNGGFEMSTHGVGQDPNNTVLTDWTVAKGPASYTFVFNQSSADGTGSPGEYGDVALWSSSASPNGGNFIGADPGYQNSAITQTITGLKIGQTYDLSFDWAGAQQKGFSGMTSEGWDYSLGSSTGTTGTVMDTNHGFTGWMTGGSTFVATSTSEVLSFLSIGTPSSSEPPFALLDGVSLTAVTAVPEPATWAMMLVGFGALGGAIRSRRRQALATA